MKVVAVKFKSENYRGISYNSKPYYYKTFFEVEVGEEVIVDTSTGGLKVAMVYDTDVSKSDWKKATKYLIQKVDKTQYEVFVQRDKELKEIKAKMDARVKELQEITMYEVLAEKDLELSSLLQTYKLLNPEL